MRLSEVLVVYLLVGIAVAAATHGSRRWLAIPLWPLVLPALLGGDQRFDTVAPLSPPPPREVDAAIQRVTDALALWDAAPPLPLDALRRALGDLEGRCTSLAALLSRPEHRDQANVVALSQLHDQLRSELTTAISRLDELVTKIQLAHFGGGNLGDLGEQLAALVAAVEGARSAQREVDQS